MSNIIPPLLSTTPPPIVDNFDEDEDDEFGDYRTAGDASFACDSPSIPPTPEFSPKKAFTPILDINRNSRNDKSIFISDEVLTVGNHASVERSGKDFCDKRKSADSLERRWDSDSPSICDTHTQSSNLNDKLEVDTDIIHENNCDAHRIDVNVDEFSNKLLNGCEDSSLSELNGRISTSEKAHGSENVTPDDCSEEILSDGMLSEVIKNKPEESSRKFNSSSTYCTNGVDPQMGNNEPQETCEPNTGEYHLSSTGFSGNSASIISESQEGNDQNTSNFSEMSPLELPNTSLFPHEELEVMDHYPVENLQITRNATSPQQFHSSFAQKTQKCNPDFGFEQSQIVDSAIKHLLTSEIPSSIMPESEDVHDKIKEGLNEINSTQPHLSAKMIENCDFSGQQSSAHDNVNNLEAKDEAYDPIDVCTAMSNKQTDDDDFDDFVACTDVICMPVNFKTESSEFTQHESYDSSSKFGDFADFTSATMSHNEEDDDFGDFESKMATTSQPSEEEQIMLEINCKDVIEKAEKILKIMFEQVSGEPLIGFGHTKLTENDAVFNQMKDITETKALSYQWANSSSQKSLLKALNIDESEILYGPSWNISLPRFAANLSTAPLEPVRSDMLSPTSAQTSNPPSFGPCNVEVPTAQFDWSSSGLTNPLDYSQTMLLDLEHLVQTLDISGSLRTINCIEPVSSTVDELEEWDLWLKSKAAKEKSVNSCINEKPPCGRENGNSSVSQHQKTEYDAPLLSPSVLQPEVLNFPSTKTSSTGELSHDTQLSDLFKPSAVSEASDTTEIPCDDFEFSGFQSSSEQNWSVPLRETHISEPHKSPVDTEFVGWLQPTILTPVLPRKDEPQLQDDDFDDFQMVVPGEEKPGQPIVALNIPSTDSIYSETENESSRENEGLKSIDKLKHEEQPKQLSTSNDISDFSDEEFTDFYSSLPVNDVKVAPSTTILPDTGSSLPPILQPLHPVPFEPLKPVSVQSIIPTKSTQINWPNPGITDEDLNNIDLSYSVKTTELKVDRKLEVVTPKKLQEIKRNQVLDEDDWSDFVSVQDNHKQILPSNKPERTSTPDLPLSVLNLGQVQPIKPPIPVITPKGLIQTQLPSSVPPLLKVVQTSIASSSVSNMQHVNMRPSLITNQFIGQVYQKNPTEYSAPGGSFINSLPNTSLPVNSLDKTQHAVNVLRQTADDDDYWSDFVSSKPAQQSSANIQPPKVSSTCGKSLHHVNGMFQNMTPNIITNPSHFDAFQSYVTPSDVSRHKKGTSSNSRKSALSNISAIPDLDFVAPKSRISNRK